MVVVVVVAAAVDVVDAVLKSRIVVEWGREG